MNFENPSFLVLLLFTPILLYFEFFAKQKENSFHFPPISGFYNFIKKNHVQNSFPKSLFVVSITRHLATCFLILALARPVIKLHSEPVISSGVDIFMGIDISGSMRALDFEWNGKRQNRLEIIKKVLGEFVSSRPNDRLGLVVFGTESFIQSPLTIDHKALLESLSEVQIGDAGEATAIGSAIATAAKRFSKINVKSKVFILLTDGESNAGAITPIEAAEAAKTLGVKLYTIGVGSNDPVPFPIDDPLFGQRIVEQKIPVDEESLKKIAEIGNGRFFRAKDTENLKSIYQEIDKLEKTEATQSKTSQNKELYQWFSVIAAFFICLDIFFKGTRYLPIPL